jgi:cytidylate kinase
MRRWSMAIITISRELAALGEEIARELSKATGYKLIDREYLEKRLGDFGVGPEKRQKYDEKKPGFWASLSQERDDYLHFLKTALFQECLPGACIAVGRGAGAILKSVPSLVSVRVVAPLASRVERVMRFYSCDERHALQIVEQSDHDRIGFHKYFFSIDSADPREYDLVVNTARLDVPDAVKAIDGFRSIMVDADREKAGRDRVADLLLGQTVVSEIVYARKVPVHFLEAAAEGGRIVLHGVANTQAAIDSALAAARSVPGVVEAESAIQVVQEFTVMP